MDNLKMICYEEMGLDSVLFVCMYQCTCSIGMEGLSGEG